MNFNASTNGLNDLELDELEANVIYSDQIFLNGTDITTLFNNDSTIGGLQNQVNNLQTNKADKSYVDTHDYNLQTQITSNLNKNNEQDTRLSNIENKNTQQDNSITSINNSITTINSTNSTQNTRLNTIEANAIYTLQTGNITTTTLSAGSNSSVSLTISQPSSNSRNLNFSFSIPQGQQGIQGLTGSSFIWKGEWNTNNPSYNVNDVVYYNGSSYICIIANTIDLNPSENLSYWSKMCEKGDRGQRGDSGGSGLGEFLSALGIALAVADALGILASVFSIKQNADSLNTKNTEQDAEIASLKSRANTLENKTQNIQNSTNVATTNMVGTLNIKNGLSQETKIILNGDTGSLTSVDCSINNINSSQINNSGSLTSSSIISNSSITSQSIQTNSINASTSITTNQFTANSIYCDATGNTNIGNLSNPFNTVNLYGLVYVNGIPWFNINTGSVNQWT